MRSSCIGLSWKILLILFLLGSGIPAPLQAQIQDPVQAVRSYDFYNSVGVDVHWYYGGSYQYESQFSTLVSLMQQAGISHFRDGEFEQGYNTPSWLTAIYQQLAASGMKADLIVAQGQTTAQLEAGLKLYPGVEAIEPSNELDDSGQANWVSTLDGELPSIRQAGADLGLTVLGPSLINASDAAEIGDVGQYMQYDNMHPYPGGRNPETEGWGAGDAEGNGYGSLAWNQDMVHEYGPGLAAYATETGYQTTSTPAASEVPETVAGTYTPRLLLYSFKSSVPRTYLYELIDDPSGGQPGYGLLRYDLSPKPSYTAISNLLHIYSDSNTQFTPGSLDYSLVGDTSGVESLLIQKSNGDFYLNVWLAGSIYNVNALVATPQTPQPLVLTLPVGESVASVINFNPDGTITQSTPNLPVYAFDANSCVTTIRITKAVAAATPTTAAPTFSIGSGTYAGAQKVSLSDVTPDAQIYYTTDNSTPTADSNRYAGPITVGQSETINAVAAAPGYGASQDSSASYTIDLPADYSVAVTPSSLTLTPGQSTATIVSVDPQNGFNSSVKLACTGLPAGASCRFAPAVVSPLGSAPANAKLTVASTATPLLRREVATAAIPVGGLGMFLCGWRRRREAVKMMCIALICAIGLAVLTGCASFTVRPQGLVTSTVTVTAKAGSLQHAATLSLTMQ